MDVTKREITKIAREVAKFTARTMKADGVGVAEFDVVHAVRKNPGITQAEICKILGADKGAVAKQTTNLEAKGYIRRAENPADGRSQMKYSKAHIESLFYEWLLEALDEDEKSEFARLLDRIYRRCKEESKAGFAAMTARIQEGEN